MVNLLGNFFFCRIVNGFDFKGIVMVFYKVVLRFKEGFVFNFIKDIVLLIEKKKENWWYL